MQEAITKTVINNIVLLSKYNKSYNLNVSRIMVNSTNLPSRGTTKLVGGIISAKSKKNTVSDSRMLMARLTCPNEIVINQGENEVSDIFPTNTFSPESEGR